MGGDGDKRNMVQGLSWCFWQADLKVRFALKPKEKRSSQNVNTVTRKKRYL